MSIAIATTALRPDATFLVWADYHLKRVKLIFVYADTPEGFKEFKEIIENRPIFVFEGSKDAPHLTPESRVVARQNTNIEHAIRHLTALNVDWLLHIDIDEILYETTNDAITRWSDRSDLGHVTFINHEAMPVRHDSTNPFTDCTYFKINGKLPFMAYSAGKSAVRLSPSVTHDGPHRFVNYTGDHVALPDSQACLLHYTTPTFNTWAAKFSFYGNFSGNWLDDPSKPMKAKGMLESRDAVVEATASGDWSKARAFFNKRILEGEELEEALVSGAVREYRPFA